MLATMRRITVKLPDDVDKKLRHEAAHRGSTIGEIARAAIEAHVGGAAGRRLIAAKAGRSGTRDTARRIESIIRQEARRSR
jgi:predicted transcriptional regulator